EIVALERPPAGRDEEPIAERTDGDAEVVGAGAGGLAEVVEVDAGGEPRGRPDRKAGGEDVLRLAAGGDDVVDREPEPALRPPEREAERDFLARASLRGDVERDRAGDREEVEEARRSEEAEAVQRVRRHRVSRGRRGERAPEDEAKIAAAEEPEPAG